MRDDVQYYRDLYNLERVEALKGPNAMVFGRGGGGGVVNRVTKEAGFQPVSEVTLQAGGFGNKRVTGDVDRAVSDTVAVRLNGVYENSDSFRNFVNLERYGVSPTATIMPERPHARSRSATSTCTTGAWPIAASRRIRTGRRACPSTPTTAIPTTASCART